MLNKTWNSTGGVRKVEAEQGGRYFISTNGGRQMEVIKPEELERVILVDESYYRASCTEVVEQSALPKPYDAFLASLPPMKAGRVRKSLEVTYSNEGQLYAGHELISVLLERGYVAGDGEMIRPGAKYGIKVPGFLLEYALYLSR